MALVPASTATSCGCAVITGAAQAATMSTMATALSTVPQRFVARNQYKAGANSGGVTSCCALPLVAGVDVSPLRPSYQARVIGGEPSMPAYSVAELPATTLVDAGCTAIDGFSHGTTDTNTVSLLENAPQPFAARTQ